MLSFSVINKFINQLPRKTLKDSLTKSLNHMEVAHRQVLKAKYLLENIYVEYLNSNHAKLSEEYKNKY